MDVVLPLVLALTFGVGICVLATSGLTPAQMKHIRPIVLGAFGLRVVMSTIFAMLVFTRVFHDDASGTEYYSIRIASAWLGDGPPLPHWAINDRNYGLTYFFAGVLYVTGRYALNITIFNSLIGAMNTMLIYRIGLKLVDEKVARRAALFVAFFPSMIIWSSIALKDPLMSFFICVTLLSAIHLRERFSLLAVAGCLLPMLAVYPIRFYLVYFMASSLVGTIALGRKGQLVAGLSKQVVLLGGLAVIVVALGFYSNAATDLEVFDLEKVSSYRRGMASTANSAFAGDVDVSTPGRAILFLPVGLSTLIWGPFPWQMTSLRPLLSAPEMLVWWYLAPSLVRGFWFAVRRQFRLFAPIIVFALITLVGYSLTLGNLGAAYRMRAQVFTFLFLFAALGQYLKKVRARGLDDELLLLEHDRTRPARRHMISLPTARPVLASPPPLSPT